MKTSVKCDTFQVLKVKTSEYISNEVSTYISKAPQVE